MRRVLVFVALAAPAAIWAGVVLWAQSKAAGSTPALGELSFPIRVAIASSNWVVRLLPFAAIPVMLAWPLIIPGIAALADSAASRNTATRTDVLRWWCISGGAFAVMIVTAGAFYVLRPAADPPAALLASLAWMGVVAFWVSMAAAYSVQQKRYAAHQTSWHPRKVLLGLLALNCVGLYALPILAAIIFRTEESSHEGAVEQTAGLPRPSPSEVAPRE